MSVQVVEQLAPVIKVLAAKLTAQAIRHGPSRGGGRDIIETRMRLIDLAVRT